MTPDPHHGGGPAERLRRRFARRFENSGLLTDLYQLNMVRAYLESGMTGTAVFEFFVRRLPERRNFLLAAGLEQVVEFLEGLRFGPDELDWLMATGRFDSVMIDYLSGVRFEGDVDAMPEGTVFFPNEPIIRIAAPLPLAQLIETRIINLLHYQCLVASKAARMVLAAPGKILLDFGLRRAHAGEAGMLAARASYLAGFTGTATVAAEPVFGVPIFGTMAHSFIQAHTDEVRAFEDFAHARPEATVFLIDTYDTESAAEKVVSLAPQLRSAGIEVQGVRIDSGDLVAHARKVRAILNSGGLPSVKIFASGGLDEDDLLRFESEGAPIDGYGIGTSLTTSSDVPALDCAYKLQEFEGVPRRKKSEGKETWPGRKQVFRLADADGGVDRDVVALVDEPAPDGYAPLLQPVMRGGHRVGDPAALDALRDAATRNLAALPVALREMRPAPVPSVGVSDGLRDLARQMDAAER